MSKISLDNVQSNILKYHFRKHTSFLLIRFHKTAKPLTIKKWISVFPEKFRMTSGQKDLEDYQQFKSGKNKGGMVMSLLISKFGYQKMDFKKEDTGLPKDDAFWEGMKARGPILNDSTPDVWEQQYVDEIDLMIVLANNSTTTIEKKMAHIADSLKNEKIGRIIFEEKSVTKKNAAGKIIEHFGFRDGLSQPSSYFQEEDLKYDKLNFIFDDYSGGSYLVLRKLEQNVKLFNEKVDQLSQSLRLPADYIGARMLGRYKDGTPLTKAWPPFNGEKNGEDKTIDFKEDPNALKCPFHAHVRKMNPQQDGMNPTYIVRRGATYDDRKDRSDPNPEKGVGLLFICYQASIQNQFEVMQSRWANDPDFPEKGTGIDPLIGQLDPSVNYRYSRNKYNTAKESAAFNGVVSLKGGAYFYAPSISFLKNILSYPKQESYTRKMDFSFLMRISNSGNGFGY